MKPSDEPPEKVAPEPKPSRLEERSTRPELREIIKQLRRKMH